MKLKLKYLDEFIKKCDEQRFNETKTRWYDSGVRNVELEYFVKGLEKAKRLVNKTLKEYEPKITR
jgi:hypothetical protein